MDIPLPNPPRHLPTLLFRTLLGVAEIPVPSQVEEVLRQHEGLVPEAADVAGPLDEVARLAAAQFPLLAAVTRQQLIDQAAVDGEALAGAIALVDSFVLLLR